MENPLYINQETLQHCFVTTYHRENENQNFRKNSWYILNYNILFIKLTIKLISSVQKNILAFSLNKSYVIA